jgi:NADPH-dependent 2,4-dienoyl-CoA reductase/sulfur reductase-like enzyme
MIMETEVAIVGGGPAGLAATVAAAEVGCRVTLIDAYARPGGQYYKRMPAEFGAHTPGALHHDFSVAEQLFARLEGNPLIQVLGNTSVWTAQVPAARGDARADSTTPLLSLDDGTRSYDLRAQAVILAPGAYDRALPFPGWDLPGVLTVGAAQTLVKSQRVLPGRRVVLSGAGPFLLPVAAGLAEGGAEVAAVYEATWPPRWARHTPRVWNHWDKLGEAPDYLRVLRRHRVPLRFGRAVVRAEGAGRVERVTVARLAADWTPRAGGEEHLEVDTLCIGYGFVPSTELSYLLGCAHRYDPVQGTFIATHNGDMESSRPGMFVAGEITGIGGSAVALPQGALAGLAAARRLGWLDAGEAVARMAPYSRTLRHQHAFAGVLNRLFALQPGWMRWLTPDTVVCRCEEVTYGQVQEAVREYHAHDARTVKLVTRCGMGVCQGRVCGHSVTALTAAWSGRSPADVGMFTGRPIVKPVALGDLAAGGEG